MKVQELIDLIISEYPIYSMWDAEEIIGKKAEKVASGLDLDEHRWYSIYSIATDVYKCDDGFVGIRGAYQSFSEQQGWSDIDVTCFAEEYEAVQTITYKPK